MKSLARITGIAGMTLFLCSAALAAPPVVKTVPWVASNALIPHDTFVGKAVTLKGTSDVEGPNIQFTWDFGDGTPVATGAVTSKLGVQAVHTYTGSVNQLFTARLTITNTTTNESASKTYFVQMREKTLQVEVNVAIDEALWALHKAQRRYVASDGLEYADWANQFGRVSYWASNINAFEANGHLENGSDENPYAETVRLGLRAMFSALTWAAISNQTYGNPDTNGNGIGIGLSSDRALYENGMVMDAIVATGNPNGITTTGAAASPGSPGIKGRSYRDIVQDMADLYYYCQTDYGDPYGGGWRYGCNDQIDNSACQWAAIGILAAERNWGLATPAWVKQRNQVWLAYSQNAEGWFGYDGPGTLYESGTPSALVQLVWNGRGRGDSQWDRAEAYVRQNRVPNILGFTYVLFSFAKAMLLHQPAITTFGGNWDWYAGEVSKGAPFNGIARILVDAQRGDGYIIRNGGDYTYHETPWSVIMLGRTIFESGGPVSVPAASPNPAVGGQLITFNGSGSFHQDAGRRIVLWEWDLNNDGTFEKAGITATSSFPTVGEYPVKLRVTDDAVPAKTATATMTVRITLPPLAPTANAGGVYPLCPSSAPWFLDGSGSINPDNGQSEAGRPADVITSYLWDLSGSATFSDATGSRPDVTAFFRNKAPGQYVIQLRVTDNTALAFPSSGLQNLTSTDQALVILYNDTDPVCVAYTRQTVDDLLTRSKQDQVQLNWSPIKTATGYAVYRRTEATPFALVARVPQSTTPIYLDNVVQNGVRYFYHVRWIGTNAQQSLPGAEITGQPILDTERTARNVPPTILSAPVTRATATQLYSYAFRASDPDGEILNYTLLQQPQGVTITSTNGQVRWTPAATQTGPQTITIRVTDPKGNYAQQSFVVTVQATIPTNQAPAFTSTPLVSGIAGSAYRYNALARDPDVGDYIAYSLDRAPAGMAIKSGSGQIDWTPTAAQRGNQPVIVRATDLGGLFVTQSFTVNVGRSNAPPRILSQPVTSLVLSRQGNNYEYQVQATDADGDAVTFSLISPPSGMVISAAGRITWVVSAANTGKYPVKVRAADAFGGSDEQTFDLLISNVNFGPSFSSTAPGQGLVGQAYSYQATATDTDAGDVLTFSLDTAPAGMTVAPATGLVAWTPTLSQVGIHNATLRVRDLAGAFATQTFAVQVRNGANQPPTIISTAPAVGTVGLLYSYQMVVTDPNPGDTFTYQLIQGPLGMSVSGTGLVQWTPAANQVATHSVSLQVRDAGGLTASQTFSIRVTAPDTTPPTSSFAPDFTGKTFNTDFDITCTATDSNLVRWTLEYRAAGASGDWQTLNTATTPVSNGTCGRFPATLVDNNAYRIRLRVADAITEMSQEAEVYVDSGRLKMGDFTLEFEDLRVPGFTFPISIRRLYDTKNPNGGDFGRGWRLGFSNVDVRVGVNYSVFITLPDGRRVKFNQSLSGGGLFSIWTNSFTPATGGVVDKLEDLDCPQLLGPPATLLCGFSPYEPRNFLLTTKEGLKYRINVDAGITRMEDRVGNYIDITPNGILTNFGRNVTFTRNAQGRITEVIEPGNAGRLRYDYDAQGRLVRFLNQNSEATQYFYENPAKAHYLTRIVDPLGRNALRNVFNAEGRMIAQCNADGNITTLAGCQQYDPQPGSQTFTATDSRGFRTEYTLDARGNVTTERRFLTSSTVLETKRVYDTSDNLITLQDPAGNTTRYQYDNRNNKVSETDTAGRTTLWTYGSCDKAIRRTEPTARTIEYAYDSSCKVTSITDSNGNRTEFRYSASGQRTHTLDPRGNAWRYFYDSLGQLTQLTDSFGKAITLRYTAAGDLATTIDRNGRRIDFDYDSAHRVVREVWSNGRTITLRYDSSGNIIYAADLDSVLTLSYDNLGRLISSDNQGTPQVPRVGLVYSYDGDGRVTTVQDSVGGITSYAYDALGRMTKATQSGSGTKQKRADFTYTASGLLSRIQRYSDIAGIQPVASTDLEYDCAGCGSRLSAVRHRNGRDNSMIEDTIISRDPLGDIVQRVDADGTHAYSYDLSRRLTAATHSGGAPSEYYDYDVAGNRTSSHLSSVYRYSYNVGSVGNRLLQDSKFNYEYDDQGNLTKQTDRTTSAYTELSYDFRNRLTSIVGRTATGSEIARYSYTYDVFNRRIRASEPTRQLSWVYDGHNPILKFSQTGILESRRLYTQDIDSIVADEAAGQNRWFLSDDNGSTRFLVNDLGVPLARYQYDSFGQLLSQTGSVLDNDIRFAGREFHADTNLYYNRFRWLSPSLGRFIAEDPIHPRAYSYLNNNPTSGRDPMGLAGAPPVWYGGGAVTEEFAELAIAQTNIGALTALGQAIGRLFATVVLRHATAAFVGTSLGVSVEFCLSSPTIVNRAQCVSLAVIGAAGTVPGLPKWYYGWTYSIAAGLSMYWPF